MNAHQDLSVLLPLLACPVCRSLDPLELSPATIVEGVHWQTLLREAERPDRKVTCQGCRGSFPVTVDGIPVLWSDALRNTFAELNEDTPTHSPTEQDVKAANIHVYDSVADAYDAEGVHADNVTGSRLVSAYRTASHRRNITHVDVGCGAGNVLQFFARVIDGPQIGVDISLAGLRAVRRKGFLVVVGDAEQLPIRNSSAGLITASSVLHHLYRPERLMREAYAALETGGVFLTDFDPHGRAARWGWVALQLYALRRPIFQLLSRGRRRVFHSCTRIQNWTAIAEFHNKPGEGFDLDALGRSLVGAGFELQLIFPHNCRDDSVSGGRLVKPSGRHLLVQSLSGRNAFSRRNADTLLTVSVKPSAQVQVRHDVEVSPLARRVTRKLFAEGRPALRESGHSAAPASMGTPELQTTSH